MSFLDYFRPRWRNSDADVRAEAVRQLDDNDKALLLRIVRQDSDAKVRKIALKKIDDPEILGDVAKSDPDEGLRRAAAEKTTELLLGRAIAGADEAKGLAALKLLTAQKAVAEVARRASLPSVRRQALADLRDQDALADVARNAEDSDTRRAATERLQEVVDLRDVAIHEAVREIGLAALDRISEEGALDLILKRAKNKSVRAAAKEKLGALRAETPTAPDRKGPTEASPEARRRAQLAQVCRTVDEAAKIEDLAAAEAAVTAARGTLAEIGPGAGDEEYRKRFERACAKVALRREESERIHHLHDESEAAQARRAVAEAERAERALKAKEEADAVRAKETAEQAVVREAARVERERSDAVKAEERAKREAEKAEARVRKEEEQAQQLARLVELCGNLEALAGSDDNKRVEQTLKTAEVAFQSAGAIPREMQDPVRDRYQAARSRLVIRVQEMRDTENWRRWANVPFLEALCVKAEKLFEESDLKLIARELKVLQAEWKTIGAAPREKSEALWGRFKAAGDKAYEKTRAQPEVPDEERAANQKKREDLCTQVDAIAALTDENLQWKETADQLKKLQSAWKETGPGPKDLTQEASDAILKRFRDSCDRFFARFKEQAGKLDEGRVESLKKLEGLCEQAEKIAATPDAAINWKDAAEQVKGLQADWKTVGAAPRGQSEAAWKRFREACDRFFARRKAEFEKLDAERAENLQKKEALCVEVEGLPEPPDEQAAAEQIRKYMGQWKALGPAPREQADAVWDRFRKACDRLRELGRGPAEPEVVPEAAASAAAASDKADKSGMGIGRFENKLPLGDIAAEWGRMADEEEDK
ncbi:MAG: DUF349 domain-containing protein [Myxococcales bacterium]|nr:DUF349 domain-containing protein [Myxococcales bacterium]